MFILFLGKSSDWVIVDDKFKDETISSHNTSSDKKNSDLPRSDKDFNRQANINSNKYTATSTSSTNGGGSSSTDASKRFANAKSISSQQFFGNDKQMEVSKFRCFYGQIYGEINILKNV